MRPMTPGGKGYASAEGTNTYNPTDVYNVSIKLQRNFTLLYHKKEKVIIP